MSYHPEMTLGIIGGGQLGRMTALAAAPLGIRVHIYSDYEGCPAEAVAEKTVVASFNDEEALRKFAKAVDVVTFEFENVPHKSAQILEEEAIVRPNWQSLYMAQNRLREKEFINECGLQTAPYRHVTSLESLENALKEIGPKGILKTIEMGYDGKGQQHIDAKSDLAAVWKKFPHKEGILEGLVDFDKEISVIIARTNDGSAMPFIPVENVHKSGILETTRAPANISNDTVDLAWNITSILADALDLVGLLAVEMFVDKNGALIVNELAPRPHNSGHWTVDACVTSQFEQYVRAVCDLPLGSANYFAQAVMTNLIGENTKSWKKFINDPQAKIHLYGKNEVRDGRKMGHVTQLVFGDAEIK